MLTYSMTDVGNENLYEYIYRCVKNDIISGKLEAGLRLPSKRAFAENLGVSTITVENAYYQLMAEGYIYSVPKKGYFVSSINLNGVLSKNNTLDFNMNDDIKKEHNMSPNFFADFVSNSTNTNYFPFATWAKIIRGILLSRGDELMRSAPVGGVMELRYAIAEHLRQFRGVNVKAEQIIVGAGTEYLYGLIIQLLGHDKVYSLEDPGYRKLHYVYSSNNAKCVSVSMDKKGVTVEGIENAHADVVHISPSHHFPTGIVTPVDRRYELLNWAMESDKRYIIEDDYDSEFRFVGRPVPAMFGMNKNEKVIYMNTFTKSLAPTIRISYMVLPMRLLEKFNSELGFYSCTVSNFEQYTLAEFIQKGYFEKHINRMRNFYRKERDVLIECIKNSKLSAISTVKEADSGLHFLLETEVDLSDDEIIERAAENGIRISCLSQYYIDPKKAKAHTIIINYSGISAGKIEESIRLLCDSLGL